MQILANIRFLIPALTLGILLVTAGGIFLASYQNTHTTLKQEVIRSIESRLHLLQGAAEHLSNRNLGNELQTLVSSFAAEKDLLGLLVVNAQDKVIAATRITSLNTRWQDSHPELHAPSIAAARRDRLLQLHMPPNSDHEHIEGYTSLCNPIPQGGLRPARCGFIAYSVDMAPHYAAADHTLRQLAIQLLAGLLLVSVVILLSLSRLLTQPTRAMSEALKAFAVGDRDARIPPGRNDEIGQISQTINAFLDWISEDEQALKDQQQRLNTLFETVVDAIVTIDSDGIIQSVNPATEKLFGYGPGELVGKNVSILMPSDIATQHDGFLQRYRETGEQHIIGSGREVQARTKQYRLFTAELSVSEMTLKNERYFTGVLRDVSDRVELIARMEEVNVQLTDQEERLRAVFEAVTDAIITIDNRGIIQDINPATEILFGYSRSELIGQNVSILMPSDIASQHDGFMQRYLDTQEAHILGKGAMETTAVAKDGHHFPIAASLSAMHIQGEIFFTGLIRDITEQVNLREVMEQLNEHLLNANLALQQSATTDGLTELANRRHFDEVLVKEIARANRDGSPLSLLLLDVDFFKRYNDHYGHQQGDDCLRAIAATLRDTFQRASDLPARYGGEEFVVVLPGTEQSAATTMAERLRSAVLSLGLPHAESGVADVVTISIGVTTHPANSLPGPTAGALVEAADQALYTAKEQGRNRSCFQPLNAAAGQAATD